MHLQPYICNPDMLVALSPAPSTKEVCLWFIFGFITLISSGFSLETWGGFRVSRTETFGD